MYRIHTGTWRVTLIVLAALMGLPSAASSQLRRGGGLGLGARLTRMREKMADKDTSVHYDPAVLKVGVSRQRVVAAFGQPNATRGEGSAREDVYAFYPDGSKFVEPQVSAGTIAAAVFTGGMSLATREARITIQKSKLTLYHVHYDAQDRIKSVQVVHSKSGSAPPQPPSGGGESR